MERTTFTQSQVQLGHELGARRRRISLAKGRAPRYGATTDEALALRRDVTGVLAEMAGASWCGGDVYARLIARLRTTMELDTGGDIGDGMQVRGTTVPTGHLIVHPADDGAHKFLLVRQLDRSDAHWEIAGWLYGRDAKKQCYWKELQQGRPAYCVPGSVPPLNRPWRPSGQLPLF